MIYALSLAPLSIVLLAWQYPLNGATQVVHPNAPDQRRARIIDQNPSLAPIFYIRPHWIGLGNHGFHPQASASSASINSSTSAAWS
jgi:hypothetical protein